MVPISRADAASPRVPGVDELRRVGLAAGLASVGVTSAEVLEPARSVLVRRREAGLAATMQFTYRNPTRSTDPELLLPGARSILVGLYDYRRSTRQRPVGTVGQVARYARVDFYAQLRAGLGAIAEKLVEAGWRARVVADSNALVDRNAAWRAGLGWYGKNTHILNDSGSWYVLGAVVTDAELPTASRTEPDGCGSCTACIDGCPTDAIVAPGVLDARRCIAWLVQAAEPIPHEYREAVEDRIYGCDICQEVCPPNRISDRRGAGDPAEVDSDDWVDIERLLEASDQQVLEDYGRWYLANRDPDVLRRTALVVLGNTADPDDQRARELLEIYLANPSPLLRAHAVWAARRLGHSDLVVDLADDPSPAVRDELQAPVRVRRRR